MPRYLRAPYAFFDLYAPLRLFNLSLSVWYKPKVLLVIVKPKVVV